MNETIYKIALAGLLHDIGKFAERADMNVSQEYLNNNAGLYQPFYKNHYTHKHAVYTAAFIEQFEKVLPKEFNKAGWGLDDPLINLAAGHHKPETPMQWIIAIADRVSSGLDRKKFDDYNKGIDIKDYKKTRLLPIFEGIDIEGNWTKDTIDSFKYRYPLKELSPDSIFPVDSYVPDNDVASQEYKEVFKHFVDYLERLAHKNNISLWLEHFNSLLMIYTAHIPSATVGKVIPDVSLYDHLKTTAALASTLFLYHLQTSTLNVTAIQDYQASKLLIVTGDFYGIQNFITAHGGSTNKASAKLLRGRSFSVSLLSELAADMLCKNIGLTTASVILNAAGKFTLIAPNTENVREAIKKTGEKINEWLMEMFYGESAIGVSYIEASCDDFISNKFPELWSRLAGEAEKRKYYKIDLNTHGGVVSKYLNRFDNELSSGICPFCNKRPSDRRAEKDPLLGDAQSACALCRDHIYLGTNLVKASRIAVTTLDAEFYNEKEKLLEPIFGEYQVSLDVEGKLSDMAKKGSLLKYWDISISQADSIAKEITAKYITGYVPQYADEDSDDLRLLHGKKKDETKLELLDMIRDGSPKSFLHIAKMALNQKDGDSFSGVEALGVLKADVDNLGLIFSCGLKHNSISHLATLSRQLDAFFSIYLPTALNVQTKFNNIYTVFSGGDDLFLIGPWNRIIDCALFINEKFKEYICHNPSITISVGITVCKPNEPVPVIYERADDAVKKSKRGGRNSITLFEETVSWSDFGNLHKIRGVLEQWLFNETVNNAMLFRLNYFLHLAKQEKELRRMKESISLDEWECLKWRSLFKYNLARNVGKKLKGSDKNKAIEEVEKAAEWLTTYGGAFKIPLWQILYDNR